MSEFSERIVKQTEALLHFQHDETLQETTPERLHEALGPGHHDGDQRQLDEDQAPSGAGPPRVLFLRGISRRPVWSTATSSTSAFCAG